MRQLSMLRPNMEGLAPIELPLGYELHTGRADSAPVWEEIIRDSFKMEFSYEKELDYPDCGPENCWFVSIDGEDVATAASYTKPEVPDTAFLHMVAAHSKALGKGAGKLAVLAVLRGLKEKGVGQCRLFTDDFRIPAIGLYLSVGFEPVIDDEEMKDRWAAVMEKIKGRNRA